MGSMVWDPQRQQALRMDGIVIVVIIGYEQELSSLDATHLGYQMLSSYPYALDVFLNID